MEKGRSAGLIARLWQGVRWRFWRLFNDIYVSAYETILFIERNFGPKLRDGAIDIARQRFQIRREMLKDPFFKEANVYRSQDQDRGKSSDGTTDHGPG